MSPHICYNVNIIQILIIFILFNCLFSLVFFKVRELFIFIIKMGVVNLDSSMAFIIVSSAFIIITSLAFIIITLFKVIILMVSFKKIVIMVFITANIVELFMVTSFIDLIIIIIIT